MNLNLKGLISSCSVMGKHENYRLVQPYPCFGAIRI